MRLDVLVFLRGPTSPPIAFRYLQMEPTPGTRALFAPHVTEQYALTPNMCGVPHWPPEVTLQAYGIKPKITPIFTFTYSFPHPGDAGTPAINGAKQSPRFSAPPSISSDAGARAVSSYWDQPYHPYKVPMEARPLANINAGLVYVPPYSARLREWKRLLSRRHDDAPRVTERASQKHGDTDVRDSWLGRQATHNRRPVRTHVPTLRSSGRRWVKPGNASVSANAIMSANLSLSASASASASANANANRGESANANTGESAPATAPATARADTSASESANSNGSASATVGEAAPGLSLAEQNQKLRLLLAEDKSWKPIVAPKLTKARLNTDAIASAHTVARGRFRGWNDDASSTSSTEFFASRQGTKEKAEMQSLSRRDSNAMLVVVDGMTVVDGYFSSDASEEENATPPMHVVIVGDKPQESVCEEYVIDDYASFPVEREE